jgi:hypothetical protein
MNSVDELGRTLPLFASLPMIGLVTAAVLLAMRTLPSAAGRYVLLAIWLRIVLSALHDFSFKSSPLGLSWNALGSIAAAGLGLLVVRRRSLFDPALVPFLLLFPVMIVSGVVNGEVPALATALTKYAYLLVLILAVADAVEDVGPDRLLRAVLVPFALALGLQALSLLLGVAKANESDGSASYIGGFSREAAFSVTLAAAVLAECLVQRGRLVSKFALITLGLLGIFLANYRTAILAVMPLVGVIVLTDVPRRFVAAQRGLVVGAMALAVVAAGLAGAIAGRERFADVGAVASGQAVLIQRPELFSDAERNVMSGRPVIWSEFYYAWADSGDVRRLVGHGPEASENYFTHYAHNTLIAALFETGLLGALAMLFLWFWMIGLALLARGGPRLELAAGHLAFLILNMATMPMWMIEGMIFYGLLCGYTVWAFKRSRAAAAPEPARFGPAVRAA